MRLLLRTALLRSVLFIIIVLAILLALSFGNKKLPLKEPPFTPMPTKLLQERAEKPQFSPIPVPLPEKPGAPEQPLFPEHDLKKHDNSAQREDAENNKRKRHTGACIAIVIDDLGLNHTRTAEAIALPPPITMAFLPYAPDVAKQANAARQAGHDVIVHVPMEPLGDNQPGPNALLATDAPEILMMKINKALDAIPTASGLNNHMGSRTTSRTTAMDAIAPIIKSKGMWFLDSRTNPASVAERIMRSHGIPATTRDVFLDNTATKSAIMDQLAETEAIAKRKAKSGHCAVAIGHPYPVTLDYLAEWSKDVQTRGITLVYAKETAH